MIGVKTTIGKARPGKTRQSYRQQFIAAERRKYIYAYFKSGDFACCSAAGEIVWQLNLQDKYGEDTLWWDLGTSPV